MGAADASSSAASAQPDMPKGSQGDYHPYNAAHPTPKAEV